MKNLATYRAALIACSFFIYIGVYNLPYIKEKNTNVNTVHINDLKTNYKDTDISPEDNTQDNNQNNVNKADKDTLISDRIHVKNTSVALGDSINNIIEKMGIPSRIDDTEYNFQYYIYNNDYKRLLYLAVIDCKIVGYYTDSIDFNYKEITSASDIKAVNKFLGTNYSLDTVLTYETKDYTTIILMDALDTGKVTGIYTLSRKVKLLYYPDGCFNSIELMVYDLINSARARNNSSVLSWSSSAANAARKHSRDMADNDFFSHVNPDKQTPSERLNNEGIYCKALGENIIAGYGGAIFSNHAWFNSKEHRKNLLDNDFRYVGVGFIHNPDSIYGTYITQDYYR